MNIKSILVTLVIVVLSLRMSSAESCGEIIPPEPIAKLAIKLSYKDFPKVADTLAIGRIESGFNIQAVNKNADGVGTSNGVMQVNGGPFELNENMKEGVGRLREYYIILLSRLKKDKSLSNQQRITQAEQGAVRAYNIGIGRYLRGKAKISADDYYMKFHIQRAVYANYPKEVKYLGEFIGCKPTDPRYGKVTSRHAGSNLLKPVKKAGRSIHLSR